MKTLLSMFSELKDPNGHYTRYMFESCFGDNWSSDKKQKARKAVAKEHKEYAF